MRIVLLLLIALLVPTATALAQAPLDGRSPEARGAYVTVNVGIEVHALAQAAADTARATEELAQAVRELAASPSLSEEHKAQLVGVIERVDALSGRVAGAVERLPAAVRETREPLAAIAADVASQVRWTIAAVAFSLVAMAMAALVGFYVIVLRPGRSVLADVRGGAQNLIRSLEHAAEVVAGLKALQRTPDDGATATPAEPRGPDRSGV